MKKIGIFGLMVFLIFFIFSARMVQAEVSAKIISNAGGGSIGSIKIVKINASNNFEAGYLRGQALREDIVFSVNNLMIPFIFKGDIGLYEETKNYIKENFYFPPEIEEEMRGMEAALRWTTYIPELRRNIDYGDILLINTAAELYGSSHCSSAAVKGGLTAHGGVIVARSLDLDFPIEMFNKSYIEYLRIGNGNDQLVSIVPLPGMIGVLTGVNTTKKTMFEMNGGNGKRGIMINGRLIPDHLKQPIPWLILGRVLLNDASSVNEMIELARSYEVTDPFNPLVADENGFVVLSGNEWGWYPRFPLWDMPVEVEEAIGDKVGENYIINVNIILVKEGFYYDLNCLSTEEVDGLKDGYINWYNAGAYQLLNSKGLKKEDMFQIGRAVYGEGGGYHAVVVDFKEQKILFGRSRMVDNNIVGGWAQQPFELPFEW